VAVRITTLCENTAGTVDVVAEYGLGMLIETDEINILFDTGADISVGLNAEALNIDLSLVDKIVLSHGHIDHTGGLGRVLEKINGKVEIIAHPDVWSVRYNRSEKGDWFIGIPFRQEQLECMGAIFHLANIPVKITDDIMTTGEIPMINAFENIDPPDADGTGWWLKVDNELHPDQVMDDQALIIKTEVGLVIVLGCAHRGIINTISQAQKLTGIKQVYAVLGGAHLAGTSKERIWQTIGALRDFDVKKIGLCHCTGLPVSAIMAQEFGDRFFFNNAGTVVEIP
jgi:7,8-dihydropterin-6-yl-methyl-4-(beta-D-ribofuranosyl)aminobenzene 5'-phosphate synthase